MTRNYYFILICILISCKNKTESLVKSKNETLNSFLLDSLKFNSQKDEYTLRSDSLNYSVLIKSYKNNKIGIISIGGKSLCVYIIKNENWYKMAHTIKLGI